MWSGASSIALRVLGWIVKWSWNNSSKIFQRLFSLQPKRTVRLKRERTIKVTDEVLIEISGDMASGKLMNAKYPGGDIEQIVKSLPTFFQD
jgi:hypothetical protein